MTLRRASPWIVVAAALALYLPAMRFEFVDWDDGDMIVDNPLLARVDAAALRQIWSRPHLGLYTPVTYTVWSLVAVTSRRLFGTLDPRAFHAANAIVHAGASLLALLVLRKVLAASERGALLGALLFALHPIQVEPVAWCASFNTVLSGALTMLALLLATQWMQRERASLPLAIVATLAFVAAMLAKPSAVGMPLALAALALLLPRTRRALTLAAVWVLLAVPVIAVARWSQPASNAPQTPLWFRPIVAADAGWFYFRQLVAPLRLCIDYGRSPGSLLGTTAAAVTWIVPVGLLIVTFRFRRSFPALLAGLIMLIASVAPVLGLVPFDFQIYSTVADRYAYIGVLGVALVVGAAAARSSRQTFVIGIVTIALLGARAFAQLSTWSDTQSLIAHTLSVNPASLAAERIRAFWLARNGRLPEAIVSYDKVLATRPRDTLARFNLANTLLRSRNYSRACAEYEMLQFQGIDDSRLHTNFGVALMQLGQLEPAGEQFSRAAFVGQTDADAQANFGRWLEAMGRTTEAISAYRRALQLNPSQSIARDGMQRIAPRGDD